MILPTKTNPVASGEEAVDSETLSPLWFAGIYENHFQYQVQGYFNKTKYLRLHLGLNMRLRDFERVMREKREMRDRKNKSDRQTDSPQAPDSSVRSPHRAKKNQVIKN